MPIRIKRLLPETWPAITPLPDVFPQNVFDDIRNQFGKSGSRFLVAEDQDVPEKILGCGGFVPMSKDTCEIHRLVVAPPFQRRGVGQRILTFLMKEAMDLGYQKMRIQVPANVQPLLAFYPKLGFQEVRAYRPCSPDEFRFFELDLSTIELIKQS